MPQILDLMQIQAGTNDSDWGTVMTLTSKLMGISDVEITPEFNAGLLEEIRNSVHPGYVLVKNHVQASAKLSGAVLYEDFPYWLDAALGTATPTLDSEYTRAYTASVDWASTDAQPKIFALGYGANSSDGYIGMPGANLSGLTVKGAWGDPLTFDAEFIGKEAASSDGALAALSDRNVTPTMGHQGSLFVDVGSDAVGTTAVTTTAFSFELSMKPNRSLVTHLGSLTPDNYKHGKWEGTLKLVLELTSDQVVLFNQQVDPTVTSVNAERVIRLSFAITSDAAPFGTPMSLRFDFAGVLLKKPMAWGDADGVATIELEYAGIYNSVLATWLAAQSVNGVSALP